MTCEPSCPCGCGATVAADKPLPGDRYLHRRVGEFHGFVRELVETVERQIVAGRRLGSLWDIEGDPAALRIARLWAYVAATVVAYSDLTANEAYLPTAKDWTDVRRIAALVGFEPRPAIAAEGWVVADVERGANPVVPAGTRVQAPGAFGRAAQTFEVVTDTALRSEWADLTATWAPQPAVPKDRSLRFLADPRLHPADRVLFVLEEQAISLPPNYGWLIVWSYLWNQWASSVRSSAQPIAVATVTATARELGTTVVSFDRDLHQLLPELTKPYAAYRVLATAGPATKLERVLRVPATGNAVATLASGLTKQSVATNSIILDRPLDNVSAHMLAAVVDWASAPNGQCDVVEIKQHAFVNWEIAPGSTQRVSQLIFANPVPTLSATGPVTVHVLDRRLLARHYVLPDQPDKGPAQLRLYPRPAIVPDRIAVAIPDGDAVDWQVFDCEESADQESTAGASVSAPTGLILDLSGPDRPDIRRAAPASANLVRVRHGTTTSIVLGSGDATRPGQRFTTPDAPIASVLDLTGTPVPSLDLRVEGIRWDEVPTLFGAGGRELFRIRRSANGAEAIEFGDGTHGARLPTGRDNVTATYRVGGGRIGEVESGAITNLLGSVKGVKKVRGAGPTAGAADGDDPVRMRTLAPTRARVFGRAVSAGDIADLTLGYPGVTHAACWRGPGPPGCRCGGSGLHVAFVRGGPSGPKKPDKVEVGALASYIDSRRDATIPLCTSAGTVNRPTLTVSLAVDPRRVPSTVAAAVADALADPAGPLGPERRMLGQALDRSDVFAVIHSVAGVVGVASLDLPGATGTLGRAPAKRYELLVPSGDLVVSGVPA